MGHRIKLVTGFTPIPDHPRPPEKYIEWGKKLCEVNPKATYGLDLEQCWLYQFLQFAKLTPTHSTDDNPRKNTLAYHIVQHQKVEMMVAASQDDQETDVFAWVDFGIFGIPGMTADVITKFMRRAANEKGISIPGCWPRSDKISDNDVCWRFCGGLIVCHRNYLVPLDHEIKTEAVVYLKKHNHVTFEVNTLARVENKGSLPIFWYQADHNSSMFSAYPETRWVQ